MVSRAAAFKDIGLLDLFTVGSFRMSLISAVLISKPGGSPVCFWSGSLSSGRWCFWLMSSATWIGDVCFSLDCFFHFSTCCLFGWSVGSLLYLSVASSVALSLRRSIGSMFDSISHAAVGVVLSPPHISLSAWFWIRSSCEVVVLLATVCKEWP